MMMNGIHIRVGGCLILVEGNATLNVNDYLLLFCNIYFNFNFCLFVCEKFNFYSFLN